jgi:hypothetical protein
MARTSGIGGDAGRRWISVIGVTFVLLLTLGLTVSAYGDSGKTAAGVVIALDAPGGQVTSFRLRTTDGQIVSFDVGVLETDGAAFPASHLAVHAATLGPIAVAYRVEGDRNVVYRMVDAPWAQPS